MTLLEFNKEQMKFPRKFKMFVKCDPMHIDLQLTPDFPFANEFMPLIKKLEEEWKCRLLCKPCDVKTVYPLIQEILAGELNKREIGVVAPVSIVEIFENEEKEKRLRSQYCFFIKNSTACEAPSFEEWLEKYY